MWKWTDLSEPRARWLVLAIYSITAWYSVGYHHPDEHFQLLEFANYKIGGTPASALPWEFAARIRPGLQPAFAWLLLQALHLLGLNDPFTQAFLLRWLSVGCFVGVAWLWMPRLSTQVPAKWLWLGLGLAWFMPYLAVRFSSENWAGMTFLTGLYFLLQYLDKQDNKPIWQLLAAGFLLALSFYVRFQMAFAGIGIVAWLLWQHALNRKEWLLVLPAALLAVVLGTSLDYWLYGEWVCTPYNYFTANITQGKAAEFGIEPLWYYCTAVLEQAAPPVSVLLLACGLLGWWHERRHVFAWTLAAFLLAHSCVAHKELRFMFPLLLPFMYFTMVGMRLLFTGWTAKPRLLSIVRFFLVINMLLCAARCVMPASLFVPYYRYLYYFAQQHTDAAVVCVGPKPLYQAVGVDIYFYRAPGLRVLQVQNEVDLAALPGRENMLWLHRKRGLPTPVPGLVPTEVYNFLPEWVVRNNSNDWQSRSDIWRLYRLL